MWHLLTKPRKFYSVVVCLSLFTAQISFGRVLDPDVRSPESSFLSSVASELDAQGIDTIFGRSVDHSLVPGTIRVAPLSGFIPNKKDWGSYLKETWVSAFMKGKAGFILAVPTSETHVGKANIACIRSVLELGQDVCEFVSKWLSSPPDKRVFLAFTSSDFDKAQAVGKALEKSGFTVFIFLKGKDAKPWADPAMVGEVFAQARIRLVMDSSNARSSPGVAIERECCEPLLLPPPSETPLSLALQGKT